MLLKDTVINPSGYFWEFGGQYLPEMLMPIIEEIREGFFRIKDDPIFQRELHELYKNFVWRPSPLVYCKHLSDSLWWGQIYIKNEWVNHTGAHKINHCIWQILLAKYLGKKRIIAETWAWQHGLATASVAAKFWLECVIYMGKKDYDRQRPNVYYMELAGATVIPVTEWAQNLRYAVNAAMKDLINHPNDTYYLLGTACGPNPYPAMNVFFQKVIGEEVRTQLEDTIGKSPDILVACVGWWSNAQWLFYEFLDDKDIKMIGVEAWWKWITSGEHAARFSEKQIGVVEGYKSYFLQDPQWQIRDTYSISAWLDYSGVSPQIAYLESIWRIDMCSATDQEALDAIQMLMRTEWILSALESAHAVAEAIKIARDTPPHTVIVCNLSWRGDKDLFITAPRLDTWFKKFLEDYLLTI